MYDSESPNIWQLLHYSLLTPPGDLPLHLALSSLSPRLLYETRLSPLFRAEIYGHYLDLLCSQGPQSPALIGEVLRLQAQAVAKHVERADPTVSEAQR